MIIARRIRFKAKPLAPPPSYYARLRPLADYAIAAFAITPLLRHYAITPLIMPLAIAIERH
jgi:hypothetical protein